MINSFEPIDVNQWAADVKFETQVAGAYSYFMGGGTVTAGGYKFGASAQEGTKWGTSDFVKHYWTGDGKGVTLSEVGLASEFEGNWVTEEALVNLGNELKLQMRLQAGSFEHTSRHFLALQGRNGPGQDQALSNPLYSLGSGWLNMSATCSGGSCSASFSYIDSFSDPLSFDHWSSFGPVEMPGATPYSITHSFSRGF